MSRFTRTVLCSTAVLVLCLVALPLVSTGQEAPTNSQRGTFGTRPPTANSTSSSQVKPDILPEGTATIYSNFGPGYSYDCCGGWDEDGLSSGYPDIAAMAFTPTQGTYLLTQIDFVIVYFGGQNSLKLELRDDWEGQPDPAPPMASWKVSNLPPYEGGAGYPYTIQTIRVRQLIVLQKNHRYWLVPVPSADGEFGWNGNYDDFEGKIALTYDGGTVWETTYDWNGVFDVLGKKLF